MPLHRPAVTDAVPWPTLARQTDIVCCTDNDRQCVEAEMKSAQETLVPTTPHVEGDEDIGEIRNIVGFHIRLAHGAVYRHFSETFAALDLTQKQVSVLWLVDDHPNIAQTGLAQRMRMDRATTMAIINRLEGRGLLVRGRSPDDGRKQTLNLTDSGRTTQD